LPEAGSPQIGTSRVDDFAMHDFSQARILSIGTFLREGVTQRRVDEALQTSKIARALTPRGTCLLPWTIGPAMAPEFGCW